MMQINQDRVPRWRRLLRIVAMFAVVVCTIASLVCLAPWVYVRAAGPREWSWREGSMVVTWELDGDEIVRQVEREPPEGVPPTSGDGRQWMSWSAGRTDWFYFRTARHLQRHFVPAIEAPMSRDQLRMQPGVDVVIVRVVLYPLRIATTLALPLGGWVVMVGYRLSQRWRVRKRAGLCPRCGYDLRATPQRCPECGRVSAPKVDAERLAVRL
jgi:hypothetical protein